MWYPFDSLIMKGCNCFRAKTERRQAMNISTNEFWYEKKTTLALNSYRNWFGILDCHRCASLLQS